MFQNATTTTAQGDVGEARAIYEYVKMGYVVSKPINDKAKYDLIIDTDDGLKRVQVKTSSREPTQSGGYQVKIDSGYANHNESVSKGREDGDYDILFILLHTGDAWSIPVEEIGDSRTQLVVGTKKYAPFQL